MAIDNEDKIHIDLTLFETVPNEEFTGLAVERALSPMVLWEGVVVKTHSIQRLSMMERFVIECLLALRECRIEEFWDIASMLPELTNWLLGSLVHKKLAYCNNGIFKPATDACVRALEQEGVPIEQEEQRAFIWFPETNEIFAIKEAGNLLKKLRNIYPSGQFPLPEKWQNIKRGDIIHQALKSGNVLGKDIGIITDVVDDVIFENKMCPAYYFRAMLPHTETDGWRLAIIGHNRSSQNKGSGDSKNVRKPNLVEESLPLPVLPGLAHLWQKRMSDAHSSICNALRQKFGLIDVQDIGGRLSAIVTKEGAERMSSQWLLLNEFGLGVRIKGEIEYTIRLDIQPSPADQTVQKMFILDKTIQRILAIQDDLKAVEEVCHEAGVHLPEVFERLWQLKQFCKIYELREREDFA